MTTTAPSTNPIADLPRIGPFMGCWADQFRTFGKMKFRVVGYCAYNAMGLIGSECNGIAILNENDKAVVTDEIAKEGTGYNGPSERQKAEFARIMKCSEEDFKKVCLSGRSRYA